jgi:hypothetical protein
VWMMKMLWMTLMAVVVCGDDDVVAADVCVCSSSRWSGACRQRPRLG